MTANEVNPNDESAADPEPESESVLTRIAREEDDRDLFPPDVISLFESDQPEQARRALIRAAAAEADPYRQSRQQFWTEQLKLWARPVSGFGSSVSTVRGIGTMLLGNYQPDENGVHIATKWFVILFLPIFPISSWVVRFPARGGVEFMGRTPLPPYVKRLRRRILLLAAAIVLAVNVWFAYQRSVIKLIVVNGFAKPVYVSVNGAEFTVPARAFMDLGSTSVKDPLRVTAAWTRGGPVIQELTKDLKGESGRLAVYNVRSRAPVILQEVAYGSSEVSRAKALVSPDAITVIPTPQYVFTEPPKRRSVKRGLVLRETALRFPLRDQPIEKQFWFLLGNHIDESSGLTAAAAMIASRGGPDTLPPELVTLGFLARHRDWEEQIRYAREFRNTHPKMSGAHTLYQDCWKFRAKPALVREYEALLKDNPDSGLHHYLLGRLLDGDPNRATSLLRKALELRPQLRGPHLALSLLHAKAGDFGAALDALKAYLAGRENDWPIYGREALRCLWLSGRRETIERIRRVHAQSGSNGALPPDALSDALDHIDIADRRLTWKQALEDARGRFVSAGRPLNESRQAALALSYALTDRDLEVARGALKRLRLQKAWTADRIRQTLRLALSKGAEAKDLQLGRLALKPTFRELDRPTRVLMVALSARLKDSRHPTLMRVLRDRPTAPKSALGLFEANVDLTDIAAVDKALRPHPPEIQVAGYVGAALVLESRSAGPERRPKQAAAIKTLRERAVKRALPDELPIGFRAVKGKAR